jgi:hypothetical protein
MVGRQWGLSTTDMKRDVHGNDGLPDLSNPLLVSLRLGLSQKGVLWPLCTSTINMPILQRIETPMNLGFLPLFRSDEAYASDACEKPREI